MIGHEQVIARRVGDMFTYHVDNGEGEKLQSAGQLEAICFVGCMIHMGRSRGHWGLVFDV